MTQGKYEEKRRKEASWRGKRSKLAGEKKQADGGKEASWRGLNGFIYSWDWFAKV